MVKSRPALLFQDFYEDKGEELLDEFTSTFMVTKAEKVGLNILADFFFFYLYLYSIFPGSTFMPTNFFCTSEKTQRE